MKIQITKVESLKVTCPPVGGDVIVRGCDS